MDGPPNRLLKTPTETIKIQQQKQQFLPTIHCAPLNVWVGSVGEKKVVGLVAQFNVKVEELRVLQRGVRCMLDAVHSVNGREREPNALFLFFLL
jgi:hypothetical protein